MYKKIEVEEQEGEEKKVHESNRGVIKTVLGTLLILNVGCSTLTSSDNNSNSQNSVAAENSGTGPHIEETIAHNPIKEEIVSKKTHNNGINTIEIYENKGLEGIPFEKKYDQLPDKLSYGIIMSETANLRDEPITKSKLLKVVNFYDRVELLEKVEFKGNQWYKVRVSDGQIGYIFAPAIKTRFFQFQRGMEKIVGVENFIKTAKERGEKLAIITSYIPGSRNLSKNKDKYGRYKIQSATGTYDGEELYIPDRSIAKIVENDGSGEKIKVESMSEPSLMVNDGSVTVTDRLKYGNINKAVAVDIENQNFTLYEKIQGKWTIVSYSYSKTGYESELGFQTPKGSFIADIGKKKMLYTDGDGRIEGYAYNAIRFSGGGYLHGTPITLEEASNERAVMRSRENFLGTLPGTRKCIRTTMDHSIFVYNWVFNNRSPEYEKIRENVLFVIY